MSDLDLLIAATALRHDLTLLTRDRDFERGYLDEARKV